MPRKPSISESIPGRLMAARMQEIRMGSNLTQSEFATLVKSSQGTISKCESGKAAPRFSFAAISTNARGWTHLLYHPNARLSSSCRACRNPPPLNRAAEQPGFTGIASCTIFTATFAPGLPSGESGYAYAITSLQGHRFTDSSNKAPFIWTLPGPMGEAGLPFLIASFVTYIFLVLVFLEYWSFNLWRRKA